MMALAFPRSLRALGNDRFRPSLVMLFITAGLLLLWLGWFFLGQIPIYASSSTFRVARNGMVNATFPSATLTQIETGQKATLEVTAPAASSGLYVGDVLEVSDQPETQTQAQNGNVQLYFEELITPTADITGTIQVEADSVSPAALLLRAVRQSTAALNTTAPARPR
jgi:hypothetical protein